MTTNNLELWNSVRTPDPKVTKGFKRGGGFSGTATNAVYLIQRATEHWGPMGGHWGVEIVDDKMLQGAPIVMEGAVIGHELVHMIRINLRHPGGLVPGIGQTTFVGLNKNGIFTDEEAPKKSLTDALSKALSWLGFAADIHMGLFDDNKYVNDARKRFAEAAKELPEAEPPADSVAEDAAKKANDDRIIALLMKAAKMGTDDLKAMHTHLRSEQGYAELWREHGTELRDIAEQADNLKGK